MCDSGFRRGQGVVLTETPGVTWYHPSLKVGDAGTVSRVDGNKVVVSWNHEIYDGCCEWPVRADYLALR